ncbi:glycosyltransferase family 2 protein [Chryseobacterium fistulae]|uniref:UDP-Glc:alpha-D-GlcNAc-diphosphoundecaprenol beta-1,3-glucosyltransferase WfgD n=1 Tax=Chryseobacterium fistulae TaxID=2675058 RepID=A0A6N4XQS0_9FLAO|nr:glycosyltransferase family A protein [Chryseobacterium fistulae]CAA7386112.1 UDP-Glc:alpha-D-GlcNAc-diphosphoundecaprenol beta-1,3-glucosyltransferase WfgD [Chryseobacterium fistulae]
MISVIIPIFNAEKTIIRTLDSVKAQTIGVDIFEIIIINDGSTDESKNVIEKYIIENSTMTIQLINQSNKGVSYARNRGLKIAKGDYIALLDADDEWLPKKIEKQLTYFQDISVPIDFLATRRNNNKILFPYCVINHLAEITFKKLLIRNETQPSTVIFKRKVLENTGYFNPDQRYAEDLNYWMKVSKNNKMYILDESLVIADGGKRTFGASGLSANLSAMEQGFQRNLKEMYRVKRINFIQYILLMLFYKAKYIVLLIRTYYYNWKDRKGI